MHYICEVCGYEFSSDEDDRERKCPDCGADSDNLMPEEFNHMHNEDDDEDWSEEEMNPKAFA